MYYRSAFRNVKIASPKPDRHRRSSRKRIGAAAVIVNVIARRTRRVRHEREARRRQIILAPVFAALFVGAVALALYLGK